jgi:hypothetical protein
VKELPFSITFAAFCCMFAKKRNCGNCAPVYTRARFSHIIDVITPKQVGLFGCGTCVQCFIDLSVFFNLIVVPLGRTFSNHLALVAPRVPCVRSGWCSGGLWEPNQAVRTRKMASTAPKMTPKCHQTFTRCIFWTKKGQTLAFKLFCYILDWCRRVSSWGAFL